MSQALDKLVPLTAAPLLGAGAGWLISLATGHPAITITIGAFAGLATLVIVGALLPEETT